MKINQSVANARAKAVDWGFGESLEKKTPFLWIKFQFLDLENDDGGELDITHKFYLTDATINFVLRDLEKMGWKGKSISELDKSDGRQSFDLSQKEVFLTTTMEAYKDKYYPKVMWINDSEHSAGAQPLEKNKVDVMERKLRGKIAAYRSQNGKSDVATKTTEENDEDVPF